MFKQAKYSSFWGIVFLMGCSGKMDSNFIGSAIVESKTYQVTSLVQGRIMSIFKEEGHSVLKEELLAIIDSTPFVFQWQEIEGSMIELNAGIRAKANEIKAADAEIKGLEKDFSRISPLVKEGSLSIQQEDRLASGLETARLRRMAAQELLASLKGKSQALNAKLAQVREQINRCYLYAPAHGRILTRYKNLQEVAGPGQPLFEIGREDTMQVDFFVPQTTLAELKYGQTLRLRLDSPNSKAEPLFIPATLSWIGNEAEFSPKNIQTRESRNEMVFRVRALAANDKGMLKRGLPIEVWK